MRAKNECLNLLRMSEAEQLLVLEDLEDAAQANAWTEVRKDPRYPYTTLDGVLLKITGARVDYRVRPRNISVGGLTVLHGMFVYPGTSCQVVLQARGGELVPITGKILRCRHVHGKIHELGIKFVEPIEVAKFIALEAVGAAVSGGSQPAAPRKSATELAQQLEQLAAGDTARDELVAALREAVAFLRGQVAPQ